MPILAGTNFTPAIRRLGSADIEQILDVHESVRFSSLRGALDPHSASEFAGMLADPMTAAVGAHARGHLIGYAISIVPRVRQAAARNFLARFEAEGEPFAESRGTAVLADYQRRGVASALLELQHAILHSQEIRHSFNIILQRNCAGVAARLANGAMLVGQVVDRYGRPCFLAYSGSLREHFDPAIASAVPLADDHELSRLFNLNHAALSCNRAEPYDISPITLMFSPERRRA